MLGLANNELLPDRKVKETVTEENHAGLENRRWEVLTPCQGQPAAMCSMHQQRRAPEQGTMLPDYTAS
jgi:hypothetical protein